MNRTVLTVAVAAAGAFTLFCASVALWGPWWRFAGMPTAEEWSALFGATALVALGFAWYQIRQVDQSNRALIASNEHALHVNLETVRPRVEVLLQTDRWVSKSRSAPAEGTMFIAVRNIGVSPARGLRMTVTPPFTSLDRFFKPGMMGEHFRKINETFNGEVHFETLHPGHTYIWFLGRVPDLLEESSMVPRRWDVDLEYRGSMSNDPFRDSYVLDLDVEKQIELPVDPLKRIGKDIEVVAEKLDRIGKRMPQELDLSEASTLALRGALRGYRSPGHPRPRRTRFRGNR